MDFVTNLEEKQAYKVDLVIGLVFCLTFLFSLVFVFPVKEGDTFYPYWGLVAGFLFLYLVYRLKEVDITWGERTKDSAWDGVTFLLLYAMFLCVILLQITILGVVVFLVFIFVLVNAMDEYPIEEEK